jgi:hypothetical protein
VTFFERQPEKQQPVPRAAHADLDPALSQRLRLDFLDRRVGMLDGVHVPRFVMLGSLGLQPTRPFRAVITPVTRALCRSKKR